MSMAYAKKQLAYYREMMGMPDNPPDLLAEKDAEIARLRTGDTCARMCEGTAYRIEARQLAAEIERLRETQRKFGALQHQFMVENAHLRTALIHIRDSTYRDAITLRGLADKALSEVK